jgi:hypothetical protein
MKRYNATGYAHGQRGEGSVAFNRSMSACPFPQW